MPTKLPMRGCGDPAAQESSGPTELTDCQVNSRAHILLPNQRNKRWLLFRVDTEDAIVTNHPLLALPRIALRPLDVDDDTTFIRANLEKRASHSRRKHSWVFRSWAAWMGLHSLLCDVPLQPTRWDQQSRLWAGNGMYSDSSHKDSRGLS